MHIFFNNIYTYNGAGSAFGKLGSRVEAVFEERWAASGLAAGGPRARRLTAGLAATKFEPDLAPPEKRTVPRVPSAARTSGGAPAARSGKVHADACQPNEYHVLPTSISNLVGKPSENPK